MDKQLGGWRRAGDWVDGWREGKMGRTLSGWECIWNGRERTDVWRAGT